MGVCCCKTDAANDDEKGNENISKNDISRSIQKSDDTKVAEEIVPQQYDNDDDKKDDDDENNDEIDAVSDDNCESAKDCQHIDRMIQGLKYYKSIDINDKLTEQKFVNFYEESYQSLINDYIHIISYHNDNNDIGYMVNLFTTQNASENICNIGECKCSLRYHRDRSIDNENEDDIMKQNFDFIFYRDMMDQMHCHIFHLYDMGMRVKSSQQSIDRTGLIDNTFANIRKILREQIEKSGLNENKSDNNKYNIHCNYMCDENKDDKEMTFIDGLYDDMNNKQISDEIVREFRQKLEEEHYDTDAVTEDVGSNTYVDNAKYSNIAYYLKNKFYFDSMKRYIRLSLLDKFTFSVGYVFYYWKQYANPSFESQQFYSNQNDHGGYTENELYIPLKYKSLKDEILNNTMYNLKISQFAISMNKATKLMKSNRAKRIKSESRFGLYYNINDDVLLAISNLLSLILYTDWSDLSTSFSSTFRKKISYEPLSSIKRRNGEFANWSKTLRETIEVFGQKGYEGDQDDAKWNKINNRVKGPFFCGMSFIMYFPEYNIRLNGPTSTSKQIEVATRFSTDNGIIIELDNCGYFNSFELRTFSCDWFSSFSSENEYLFFGGYDSIKIQTVRTTATSKNYGLFFRPLFYFDCMVKGNHFEDEIECDNKEYLILEKLIKHKLQINEFKNDFEEYVNNTFECFVNHKTQIVINLEALNNQLKFFKDLLINTDNMIKEIIFDLFSNCRHIIIYATCSYGDSQYKFNLLSLLSLIKSKPSLCKSNNMKITIIGKWEYYQQNTHSWIRDAFSTPIKTKFYDNNYNAQIFEKLHYWDVDDSRKEDHLIITRRQ